MDEPADGQPYVAGSPLVRLFGSPGRTKIVEAFLGKRGAELTAAEVAELAGVDRSTVSRHVDALVKVGLVEQRESPSGALYRIDADDPAVEALGDARRALLGAVADSDRSGSEGPDRDRSSEAYVERTGLVRLFGSPGQAKMVEVFLGKRGAELTGAEVADLAGIDRSTVSRNIDALVDFGLVEETRQVSNSTLYRLDIDQRVSKALWKARRELLSHVETFMHAPEADRQEEVEGSDGAESDVERGTVAEDAVNDGSNTEPMDESPDSQSSRGDSRPLEEERSTNQSTTGGTVHIKLYGWKGKRFEDIKADLTEHLGYEPSNPEVMEILMSIPAIGEGTDEVAEIVRKEIPKDQG